MDPVTATAPWWGPVVAGGAMAAGQGIISSAFNAFQAGKNRDWQERMSNTSHQREVKDLRAAGLNPILSARHGASTPPGATAQASSPDVTASALQAASLRGNLELQKAQIRDINSAAALKEVEARVRGGSFMESQQSDLILQQLRAAMLAGDLSRVQYLKAQEEIRNLQQQRKNLALEEKHSALGLAEAGAMSDFYKGVGGKISPWLEKILRMLPLRGR